MSSNLAYIDEIGAGSPEVGDTEAETNNQEESQEALNSESEVSTSDNTDANTEGKGELNSLVDSYKSQIDGMEKRIADKDEYITQLREASKQKEVEEQQVDTNDEDGDFWDDPDKTIQTLKDQLAENNKVMQMQQLETNEIRYAGTVKDYWQTVNPDTLKEAVSMDNEFAEKFGQSKEPYKTAYEYLITKSKEKVTSDEAFKDKIIQDYLAKNGITKEKKEVPPNINNGGKSSSSVKTASSDGFASIFGDMN